MNKGMEWYDQVRCLDARVASHWHQLLLLDESHHVEDVALHQARLFKVCHQIAQPRHGHALHTPAQRHI